MQTTKRRSFVLASVVATMVVGLVGIPAAHADGSISVTPASGITDPQDVTIQISDFSPSPFATVQVAECGNAYANLAPLPAKPTVTFGVLDTKDCEGIGFLSPGSMMVSPVTVAGLTDTNPTIHQTGIGSGNRSCIPSPPAVAPCFVYVSTSVNLPPFPATDISFADPNPSSFEPAATTTTVTPVGSPVAVGKIGHALVQVTTVDPSLTPDGSVDVYDGATLLGSADLDAHASASVPLGVLTHDLNDLTATYTGNGSFAASNSTTPGVLLTTGVKNVSIGDATIVEGDSRKLRSIVFPVVLSQPPTTPVLVNYAVVPTGTNPPIIGTAKALSTQVVAQAKTLNFKVGPATVKYVNVRIYGDTLNQGDHTFAVQLTMNPLDTSGYVLRRSTGNGLIIDDDAPNVAAPVISIGNSSVPEGDVGGTHAMKFAVTLSNPASATVTVPVTVSIVTASHGNKVSGDFGGTTVRKLVFRNGSVSKAVAVAAFPELNSELDETINVTLGTPVSTDTSVSLGVHHVAVGTILSDE